MGNRRISISIRTDFNDVYTYLQSLDNVSLYVCKLIRGDIQQKKRTSTDDESLKRLVDSLIDNKLANLNLDNLPTSSNVKEITEDDKDLISSIF
ncbi:hypothetical protein [Rummeliibacillus sp. TYF005]|uniref:hypothetical protein n=1 Tax=Rummeliibacillus sp. TYF005 TaxID=2058214 RepID=UPI000F529FEA|nr:hypothetical protein [Rummeliibacillus sp. TYF005]RPJ97233.1 hypothetical protein CW357_00760 [Rummeliibacillus sp. TYF005]